MARQWLWLTAEQVYGTYDTTSPAFRIAIPLEEGNAFTVRKVRQQQTIRDFAGDNIPRAKYGRRFAYAGQLTTTMYIGQAKPLLQWALDRISATGTLPWPTDQCDGDLASVTADHGVRVDCTNIRRRRYLGGKVASLQLSGDNNSDRVQIALNLIFSNIVTPDPDGTSMPEPAYSAYPTTPWLFQQSSGQITIGTSRALYKQFAFSVENVLSTSYFVADNPQRINWRGRTTSLQLSDLIQNSPNDRATFEAGTLFSAGFGLSDGTNTVAVDLQDSNFFEGLEDEMPLGDEFYNQVTLRNMIDGAAGNDFAVTYTASP